MGKRRSPGDGTLFKRKDGLWIGGVELPPGPDGKRRMRRVSSRDRNEALLKFRALKAEVERGAVPTSSTTTVGKWLDYWLSDILPARDLKPSTRTQYAGITRRWLQPHLGHKRIGKLGPGEVRALYALVQESAGHRTAQKVDQVLRLAIKAAVREGVVSANVMDRVDKPTHTSKAGTSFDSQTAARIIAVAMQTQGPMWAARWACGFLTGARESEVTGLEWARVDLDRRVIDLSWQLQRLPKRHGCGGTCDRARPSYCPAAQWDVPAGMEWRHCAGTLCWTRPKTKAGQRLIPIVEPLAAILATLDRTSENGLVFHLGGKPISQEQDQKAWKALLIAADVPHAPQHSIRHSTATLLLEAGVDTHVVQSVIGHSQIAVTRGYQHVSLDLARSAWEHLAAILPTSES